MTPSPIGYGPGGGAAGTVRDCDGGCEPEAPPRLAGGLGGRAAPPGGVREPGRSEPEEAAHRVRLGSSIILTARRTVPSRRAAAARPVHGAAGYGHGHRVLPKFDFL
eukprot:365815-Hanusia_phi.AAC.1